MKFVFVVSSPFLSRYVSHLGVVPEDVTNLNHGDQSCILVKYSSVTTASLSEIISPFRSMTKALVACLPVQCTVENVESLYFSAPIASITVPCRLTVWPKTYLDIIGCKLASHGIKFEPVNFTHVISVFCKNDGTYLVAVNPREVVFDLINDNSVSLHSSICRAEQKLEELNVVSYEFKACLATCASEKRAVLDVGASPGGWTTYLSEALAESGSLVVACDPALLDANVGMRKNVRYLPCMIEKVDWPQMVPEVFGTKNNDNNGGFGLVTCDMNGTDCRDLMRLMLTLAPLMSEQAYLVVTLKLPTKVSEAHAAKLAAEATVILQSEGTFTVCHCVWLFANRSTERTLVAMRLA